MVASAMVLGLIIGLLNSLLDLPEWIGVLCLVLFVGGRSRRPVPHGQECRAVTA